jgi:hypothetical protein
MRPDGACRCQRGGGGRSAPAAARHARRGAATADGPQGWTRRNGVVHVGLGGFGEKVNGRPTDRQRYAIVNEPIVAATTTRGCEIVTDLLSIAPCVSHHGHVRKESAASDCKKKMRQFDKNRHCATQGLTISAGNASCLAAATEHPEASDYRNNHALQQREKHRRNERCKLSCST